MIKFFDGTVFNTDAKAIVNTVNCEGFMGAGIALEYALRYPNLLNDYKHKCEKKIIQVGKVDYHMEKDILIINFPTKDYFKFPSKLKWIEYGLKSFVSTYKEYKIESVAFPKLGTSNGGLKWEDVKSLMIEYLEPLDIKVYICLDNKKEAEGKEAEMLNEFNKTSLAELSKYIKLNSKQIYALNCNRPFSRFWQIAKTDTIGKMTYESLFKYFYNNTGKQTSFDF